MQEAGQLEMKVRLSIFTIIGVCAGLPALVWSVSDLIHHRKNGHRISVYIILLLLTDFVELLLSPYILIKHLLDELSRDADWTIWVFWSLSTSSRMCGVLLNQLVALEGILSVKYPLYNASVLSSPHFIIFYILLFLFVIIWSFFYFIFYFFQTYYLFCIYLVLLVMVITWIISCGASCSADRHSHTSRKPDPHILVVFIFTLLVFYLLDFVPFIPLPLRISFFLKSMRLIIDPLLCVLVCRQSRNIQTSQNPERTSLV